VVQAGFSKLLRQAQIDIDYNTQYTDVANNDNKQADEAALPFAKISNAYTNAHLKILEASSSRRMG